MRQKLITLCPNSFEIAQKKPNFSAWVREKLLEEKPNAEGSTCRFKYKCPVCKKEQLDVLRMPRTCIQCNYAMKFEGQVVE